jgi:integrase
MNNLTSDDVRGYIAHRLQKGIENKTINKELSLLSAAIKWCNQQLDWELPNPVVGKRLPEVVKEARCLTMAEFEKLMASVNACWSSHTRNYLPDFCILGYNTMMRPGEMLELEWSRVDFVNSTVVLDVEDTKGKQRRLVPLNDAAKAALLKLKRIADDNFPDAQYVFTHTRPRSKGQRIQTVTKVWATAVKRAGIAWATPHCLRHTAITESVHVPNANVVDISRVAGHKDLKTTLGYIHVAPDRLHQTVANLPTLGTF